MGGMRGAPERVDPRSRVQGGFEAEAPGTERALGEGGIYSRVGDDGHWILQSREEVAPSDRKEVRGLRLLPDIRAARHLLVWPADYDLKK
jgi:hypothetical protein